MHTDPEVLALLALGEDAASDAERAHLEGCPVCRAELEELAHLTQVGRSADRSTTLVEPSPEVWERVRAELGFGAQPTINGAHPPLTALPDTTRTDNIPTSPPTGPALNPTPAIAPPPAAAGVTPLHPRRRVPRALALAVAAALALILGVGIGVLVTRPEQPVVVGRADLAAFPSWSGASGTAELQRGVGGGWVMQVTLQPGRTLDGLQRVWLMDRQDPSRMVSLGLLGGDDKGLWTVPPGLDLSEFDLVDVSEEPPGDLDPAHSGNSIVRGALER